VAEFDADKFLDAPIDAIDFQFMIGDVKDFLEISESNIEWLLRRELQAISHRTDLDDYPRGYREHLEENAAHRFKVSLPLRVRYSALLALITSVEWAVGYLNRVVPESSVSRSSSADGLAKTLRDLTALADVDVGDLVDNVGALVHIRNCIVHSAGILATYRHKDDLPKAVARISGVTIANWNFFGDQICIERGALEPYIDKTSKLVVDLHAVMRGKGLLK
jgi:hypothetical protein